MNRLGEAVKIDVELCIFEDDGYLNLFPLTLTRPVYGLRCGITSLQEKIRRRYPGVRVSLHCRDYLAEVVREENREVEVNRVNAESCLFINGRVLAHRELPEQVPLRGGDCLYLQGEEVVAARLSGLALREFQADLSQPLTRERFQVKRTEEVEVELVRYPWDLVHRNADWICNDFEELVGWGQIVGQVYQGAVLLEESRIYVGEGARIKPGVVLDAEKGPIYIGKGVIIHPNAVIEGPVSIGDRCIIRAGAYLHEGTGLGKECRIGGEVAASVIQGYSNKQHQGFLGHSYLGSWVNLGAGTNNSDLKNNYRSVRVYVAGHWVDTGSLFVGLMMGDHSKSGINTMFNTGTVVGVCCNVFGAGYPPKFIPSFSWGGSGGLEEHSLEEAIRTARMVMARRKVELTPEGENLLRKIFELTSGERSVAFG